MNIILASHGHLASGMKSAAEMILGPADFVSSYDLAEYMAPHVIFDKIRDVTDCIIVTDILGGSVNNALLELMENNLLITGMNLGLVLELCMHRNDDDLKDSIDKILLETKACICCVNKEKENFEVKGGEDFW